MANRFWVGGTGTWDASNTTSWSTTTGGAGGASVPGTGDAAVFDASSGGGTVTVDSPNGAGVVTVQSITMGAFASGTLDFSANNNAVTLSTQLSGTGTATRTLNMGSGTWTFTATGGTTALNMATTTNLTFAHNNSTQVFSGNGSIAVNGGGLTYNIWTFNAVTNGLLTTLSNPGGTVATMNVTAPRHLEFAIGTAMIITNGPVWTGTSTDRILLESSNAAGPASIAITGGSPAISWAVIRSMTFTTTAITASDSVDLGGNTGITINAPSAGGVVARVIGG